MEDTIKAYTAGIIDGEGYIGILRGVQRPPYRTPRYTLKVAIGMTEKVVIDWLANQFGFNVYVKAPNFKHRKQTVYTADLQAIKGASFLKLIEPWLILKKQQAALAIQFQERCTEYALKVGYRQKLSVDEVDIRHTFYLQMRSLNGREKGVQTSFVSPISSLAADSPRL